MRENVILDEIDRRHALEELEECRNEALEKLHQMKDLIRNLCEKDCMIWDRAKAYWFTSVEQNLSAESGSFLGSMTNFEETLKELKEHVKEVDSGAFDEMEKEER